MTMTEQEAERIQRILEIRKKYRREGQERLERREDEIYAEHEKRLQEIHAKHEKRLQEIHAKHDREARLIFGALVVGISSPIWLSVLYHVIAQLFGL